MLQKIKDELLNDVDKLVAYLEHFGYCNISVKPNYITFGRDIDSSPKALVIYRKDNEALMVKDFARNISYDIFNIVIKEKKYEFKTVISEAKRLTGVDGHNYKDSCSIAPFGGFYSNIKNRSKQEIKVYDENILNKYKHVGNLRFLRDNISLEAQRYFSVGYDIESQSITIPIRDESGSLIGVKCRVNREVSDGEQKYYYDVPCQMSQTLYGYSENYEYLQGVDVIYIVESEKSVMQFYSMGYRSVLALGCSSISKKQCQMILSLNPKKVVFMMDCGIKPEVLQRNIIALKTYGKMKEFMIQYWNPSEDVPNKASASDLGKQKFEEVLRKELVDYEEDI